MFLLLEHALSFHTRFRSQPAELQTCARCSKPFDAAYPIHGACRVEHELDDGDGDRIYGFTVGCSLCGERFGCSSDYDVDDRDLQPPLCFHGLHTTSHRCVGDAQRGRAACCPVR